MTSRVLARLREESDLLRAVRRIRPAVLHAHFGPVGLRALNVAKLLRLPLIVSFYGFDVGAVARRDRQAEYEALFQYARVTAEGPFLLRRLRDLGARTASLLPLSLPDWCCDRPAPRVWRGEQVKLLQICRLVRKKGVDLSIRAVAEARAGGLDVRLTIVGDGPERESLEALRRRLGMNEFVDLVGGQPYSELPRLFGGADALIQPSRTAPDGDTEGGHPMVVLEAQAQALPVVGTRHADIPMVVEHGRTGFLAPEEDVQALTSALFWVAREDRAELGRIARERALRRHSPGKVKRMQEAIYRAVVRAG